MRPYVSPLIDAAIAARNETSTPVEAYHPFIPFLGHGGREAPCWFCAQMKWYRLHKTE